MLLDFTIDSRAEVDSTNTVVRQALEDGRAAGYVCRAARQSGGYGRQGRSWSSPEGGLYQSLLLHPSRALAEWPTLALVAALGIRQGILDFICAIAPESEAAAAKSEITVKWPNDLLVGSDKLVGISCEAHAGGVCLGMGVNMFPPDTRNVLEGKNIPAYLCDFADIRLSDQAQTVAACGDAILKCLASYLDEWEREGFSAFRQEYCEACGLLGESVQLVLVPGGTLTHGIARDIDAQGRLVIENETDGIQAYSSGEVHLSR